MSFEERLTNELYRISTEKYDREKDSERNHIAFAMAHLYTQRMLRDILKLLKEKLP